ncbi:MAG: [protein-PII] uridylyltransferase [Pirellulales bacterium]|nr:[protein-PII] uridylyltransferase [Pirellulales bacterium]
MATGLCLRTSVTQARECLEQGRRLLAERHRRGASGLQVSRGLADLFEQIVCRLFEDALRELEDAAPEGLRSEVALVAHGGFGRRDPAPYSDVDLMILHVPSAAARVEVLASRLLRDLCDARLTVGHSVRTPRQAWRLARKDPAILTSLVESRLIAGSESLFEHYERGLRRLCQWWCSGLLPGIERARDAERLQYGETVYLLEPNIKRSRGGLRDWQLIRWLGFVRYGTADVDGLCGLGHLAREDLRRLGEAYEFLLRLRNEMHFEAGKANDVLNRSEQVRLAAWLGFQDTPSLLAVEQFMRDYFRRTNDVSSVALRFAASARPSPRWGGLLTPLFSHHFERDFCIAPHAISLTRQGRARVLGSLEQILRLADVANLYDKPISHQTSEAVRAAVPGLTEELTPQAAAHFLSLLSQPARLGEMLRWLYDVGALELVIPHFRHARCLLQFNEYHRYTVDEHCLRAVEEAVNLLREGGRLGWEYARIKRKWLLHLALLLHDLGKGFPEDHSEVGRTIALETARRLHLSPADAEVLVFLVHKHLLMSHLAFRRDTNDEQLVVRFAVEVGSPETLQMLFVLTVADLAAVGPGVLNQWKIDVLLGLYQRAMAQLAGDATSSAPAASLAERRAEVLSHLTMAGDREWFEKQLAALPPGYLLHTPPDHVAANLLELHTLQPGTARARARWLPDTGTVEYQVDTWDTITPGVFHKLTGVLTGHGLQILSAEIHTLADGLVFDRFYVEDRDFNGEPPPERLAEVCRALEAVLTHPNSVPTFRRIWKPSAANRARLPAMPTQVRIDNSTSERFTIIDVFAADRMGLLYTISRKIFELGLSVSVAKIGTYLDQVVDVFYVTDQQGRKIEDGSRLQGIRDALLQAVEAFQQQADA